MEESQNLDETTERDFDQKNGLVLFKNSTRSLHSEAMKNNDAIHTIDADQQTIESGSLLFKGPYSPTTKRKLYPNASIKIMHTKHNINDFCKLSTS